VQQASTALVRGSIAVGYGCGIIAEARRRDRAAVRARKIRARRVDAALPHLLLPELADRDDRHWCHGLVFADLGKDYPPPVAGEQARSPGWISWSAPRLPWPMSPPWWREQCRRLRRQLRALPSLAPEAGEHLLLSLNRIRARRRMH